MRIAYYIYISISIERRRLPQHTRIYSREQSKMRDSSFAHTEKKIQGPLQQPEM